MSYDAARARAYVDAIVLSGTRRAAVPLGPDDDAAEVFDAAKKQALIIGSGVFSFEQGVTPEIRGAISDSALLAQLVANKKAPVEQDPIKWFRIYSEVLQNLGWTLQEGGWVDYTTEGSAAQVHEKILEVATAALTPGVAALAIITATVKALKGMDPKSPWLTLFERDSQKGKIGRFQIGLVSAEPSGDVFVSLLVCLIEAEKEFTQVLFFKFKEAKARFRADSAKISVNRGAITDLRDVVRAKTRAYQQDYLSGILNLETAAL